MHRTTISPLENWTPEREIELPFGLKVVRLWEHYDPNVDTWTHYLSGSDIQKLKDTKFWICYDKADAAWSEGTKPLINLVHHAVMSVQVVAPIGGRNLTIVCEYYDGKMMDKTTDDHLAMYEPLWARLAGVDETAVHDLPTVIKAIDGIESNDVVRLINPLSLLELGMKVTEPHVRIPSAICGWSGRVANGWQWPEVRSTSLQSPRNRCTYLPTGRTDGSPTHLQGERCGSGSL